MYPQVEGGVEAQARQALKNMKAIVEAGGSEVGKVVKTTVRLHFQLVAVMPRAAGAGNDSEVLTTRARRCSSSRWTTSRP